jgi:hypothetical protein
MAKTWIHEATIKGSGMFPLDMLRYDSCYPKGSEDAFKIAAAIRMEDRQWEVRVMKRGFDRNDKFTDGRWASFGCKVASVDSHQIGG